jgi:hypothetical protein
MSNRCSTNEDQENQSKNDLLVKRSSETCERCQQLGWKCTGGTNVRNVCSTRQSEQIFSGSQDYKRNPMAIDFTVPSLMRAERQLDPLELGKCRQKGRTLDLMKDLGHIPRRIVKPLEVYNISFNAATSGIMISRDRWPESSQLQT